ncbi:MAG: hypothetical protein N2Z76_03770 [Treponemataceae bacterium]|nr:hypothetical protein [Treponemataceae bacterium]
MNRTHIWRNMMLLGIGGFLFFDTGVLFPEAFSQKDSFPFSISLEKRQEARKAAGEIHKKLQGWGFLVELQDLLKEYGGFGNSLLVTIPSVDPSFSSRTLVFACSLADTNGRELLTQLLHNIHQGSVQPVVSVRIAFLGEEEPLLIDKKSTSLLEHPAPYRGLQALLDRFEDPEAVSLIYVASSRRSVQPTLQYGSAGYIASSQLLSPVLHSLERAGLLSTVPTPYTILYKLRLITGDPRMGLIAESGIDGLLLEIPDKEEIFLGAPPGEPNDFSSVKRGQGANPALAETSTISFNTSRWLSFFKELLETPCWGYLQGDQHYSLFPPLRGVWYILPEKQTVQILLILLFILFCFVGSYSIIYRHSLLVQWIVFIRRSWILLVYYFVFVALCFGSSFFLFFWNFSSPYTQALLKIFLATGVSLGLFSFFSGISVPRRAEFYGHGAVFFLFVISLVAISLDISFFLPIVWFFMWVLLASLWKNPLLNGFALLMAPLQFGIMLYTTYTLQETTLATHLLSLGLGENILLALFVFPLLLLLKRLVLLTYSPKRYPLLYRLPLEIAFPLAILTMASFLSFFLKSAPPLFFLSRERSTTTYSLPPISGPGSIPSERSPHHEHPLGSESPASKGAIPSQKKAHGVDTTQERKALAASPTYLFQTKLHTITFFDEKTLSLGLTFKENPTLLSILIEKTFPTEASLELYSSPVPIVFLNSSTARFILGPAPPNPLTFDITLPENVHGKFTIRALVGSTIEEKEVSF